MSYRKRHIKPQIKKLRPKKRLLKSRWFWASLSALIFVLLFFYFYLFFPKFQVANIEIQGNQKVDGPYLRNAVSLAINKKILTTGVFNISTNSIFLVNAEKITKDILQKFPQIEGVDVKKILWQTISLEIKERQPVATFCDEQGECFLIDANGVVFEKTDENNENGFIVRQLLSENIFEGKDVVQKHVMDAILKIEKNLKDNYKINLREALLAEDSKLTIKTHEDWKAYFDLSMDIGLQITKLNMLLSDQITEAYRQKLEYIDLRFNRAYYK